MEDRDWGINLIIDGTSYPLTIKASEEPYYRQAAKMVNETLSIYKEPFKGEGGVRVMTMAALDIAYTAIKDGNSSTSAEVMHKINELNRLVSAALKEK